MLQIPMDKKKDITNIEIIVADFLNEHSFPKNVGICAIGYNTKGFYLEISYGETDASEKEKWQEKLKPILSILKQTYQDSEFQILFDCAEL